jgi:hypothetical protein
MAKKRTGLQSEIAGIFSGVPVPKKGGTRSQSDNPAQKPDSPATKPVDPASKRSGSVIPKPVTPQPQIPVTPTPKKIEEPLPATPKPKVVEIKASEQIAKRIPKKISKRRKDKIYAPKSSVSSSRQKAGITLFIFLSTALVIVLLRPYLPSSGKPAPTRPGGKVDNGNSTRANIVIDWPVPPVYSANLRDPMELGSRQRIRVETPDDLVVKGITYSEDRKFAVIGTQTMQEGDTILGATIVEITPSSVIFERDGKRWTQEVEGKSK